jgi:hypothetical protein
MALPLLVIFAALLLFVAWSLVRTVAAGKIDRRRLPAPVGDTAFAAKQHSGPRVVSFD